jgi:replicative DNA helicase
MAEEIENKLEENDKLEDYTAEFEKVILKAIYSNAIVRNKVMPLINESWFRGNMEMTDIVDELLDFSAKHDRIPQPLEFRRILNEHRKQNALNYFNDSMKLPDTAITEFIMEEIQDFVSRKLQWNCAQDMINEVAGEVVKDCDFAERIVEAKGFTFDDNIGLDFIEDFDEIYEEVIHREKRVRTGMATLDDLTKGGFPEKTLSLILAPTNVGKTLCMCSLATNMLRAGIKVLYLTFEDSQLKIGTRITQNLADITQEQMKRMSPDDFHKMKNHIIDTIDGKLIIKEVPEGTMNAISLKALLKALKEKKKFIPEIIFIDYIGCMVPNGRENPNWNTNTIFKLVAAQVRAVSMELGMPIVSAMQTNREGFDNASPKLNNIADSFASTTKADFILGVSQTAEMLEQKLYSLEVEKTRLGNNKGQVAMCKVDIDKQRISDLTQGETNFKTSESYSPNTISGVGMDVESAVSYGAKSRIKNIVTDWE